MIQNDEDFHAPFFTFQVEQPVLNQDFSPGSKGPFHCLLCDDIRPIGSTSYDFHKHLCENHFRERLLNAIQQTEAKEGEDPSAARKFVCPLPGCGYELPQRWVMAKHYGLKHQVAKQLYAKICNLPPNGIPNPKPTIAQPKPSASIGKLFFKIIL